MSSLLVAGLLVELLILLLLGGMIVAGIAMMIHFGGTGLHACPQCGKSTLMPLETARTDGRLPMYRCTNCGASYERALDGSLYEHPTN